MNQPKVLVGCPTYEKYEYCLERYLHAIKELTYKNYDLLLVDNSKESTFATELQKKGINVLRVEWIEDPGLRVERSRNKLREEFLRRDYDYFLSLEQDVIPPKDVIERLVKHEKDVVAGVYYYPFKIRIVDKNNRLIKITKKLMAAVSLINPANEKVMRPCPPEETIGKRVIKVRGIGLGCCLISRKTIERIKFRWTNIDDAQNFSNDCWSQGIEIYVDTSVKCVHMLSGKPKGLFKREKKGEAITS